MVTEQERAVFDRLIALAKRALVCHHTKTIYKSVEVDGELEYWSIADGCEDNCPGCALLKERDEVIALAKAL